MNTILTPQQQTNLKRAETISYIIACGLGVLFHFIYGWSGEQRIIGFFFPVNESTWEHLKLVFYPITLVSIAEYFFLKPKNSCFSCIKFTSILIGMLATIILFYSYSGILGTTIDWVNIVVYFISMAIAYFYSHRQLIKTLPMVCNATLCIILFAVIAILFMIFSIYPPDIGLFRVPGK